MDKDTINLVADIAHVYLEDHEIEQISKDMDLLLEYFDKVSHVDTEGILPTVCPINDRNVLRSDEVLDSLPIEEVLRNAPDKKDRFFRVPRIIEE